MSGGNYHGLATSGVFGNAGDVRNRAPKEIRLGIANPGLALDQLDRLESNKSLLSFIEIFWSVLEPGRKFVKGRAIEVICEHLEAVSRGQIKKLLINVPPGCMKSLTTNVFWPAWEWGPQGNPEYRYVCASYSQDLTVRDNRRCRQIIADPKNQRLFGDQFLIVGDQDAKVKFENDKRGWKIATSVGGLGTGERGDRFIIDDPHNIKDAESLAVRESTLQWFTEVVPTRVNDENAVFVVIMQRVHERDVSGLILANELDYEYLCLPMEYEEDHPFPSKNSIGFRDWRSSPGELLWPERFPATVVEDLKKSLRAWGGGYAEAGQLQQRPTPRGGGMFARKWWRFYETASTGYHLAARPNGCSDEQASPLPKVMDEVILTCDAAFKKTQGGSRVSLMVVGRKGPFRYILDNITKSMTFKETCDTILQVDKSGRPIGGLIAKWPLVSKVLIEDKANGPAIIDTLRELISGVIPINPEGGKESRASAMQPAVESGHILLPDGAPWLDDFIHEFASFPVGAKDDQVDALSQAIIYMTSDADVARAIDMAKW